MTEYQPDFSEISEDYKAFVDKFKPKKTTDDCYTPEPVFRVVLDYVCDRYGIDPAAIVRPFWPGGDYQKEAYPAGCCVVDNPPFSILSRIVNWYMLHGVRFFLFAPALYRRRPGYCDLLLGGRSLCERRACQDIVPDESGGSGYCGAFRSGAARRSRARIDGSAAGE